VLSETVFVQKGTNWTHYLLSVMFRVGLLFIIRRCCRVAPPDEQSACSKRVEVNY